MTWDDDDVQYTVSGENRLEEGPKPRKDTVIRISGSGTLSDVDAKEFVISGSGKVTGSVNVVDMHVSGSGKVEGSINCSSKLDVSGSLKVGGDVSAEEVLCSGSLRVAYCKCNNFILTGSAEIGEKIEADLIEDSGILRALGIKSRDLKFNGVIKADTVDSENVELHGAINAKRITAKRFNLESMGWASDIGTLEADEISITTRKRLILPGPRATVDEIRGDIVNIEGVNCRLVSAETVAIGDNCNIGYVEAAKMSISGKSKVGEKRTLEAGIEK